jgi:hypothetical protein
MSVDLRNFKDLLEKYYLVKNAPDNGDKQSKINRIKMDIYNDFLNLDFERNSNVSPEESKVMKEFFSEVDKNEEEYMKQFGFNPAEIAYEDGGLTLGLWIRFCEHFKRHHLLDRDFKGILIEYQSSSSDLSVTSSASSKKKKAKKQKKQKKQKKTTRNSKKKTKKSNKHRNKKRKHRHSKSKKRR